MYFLGTMFLLIIAIPLFFLIQRFPKKYQLISFVAINTFLFTPTATGHMLGAIMLPFGIKVLFSLLDTYIPEVFTELRLFLLQLGWFAATGLVCFFVGRKLLSNNQIQPTPKTGAAD